MTAKKSTDAKGGDSGFVIDFMGFCGRGGDFAARPINRQAAFREIGFGETGRANLVQLTSRRD